MTTKTLTITEDLQQYLMETGVREPAVLNQLREVTATLRGAQMQISPEQGQFMRFLIQILNAKNILEIGTFTGYSSICMAMELPADGQLIACDLPGESNDIARDFWKKAGVEDKISFRLEGALAVLDELLTEDNNHGRFDFAFIDADKKSYDAYYEKCLKLLRPGGIIAIDNMLWSGRVVNAANDDDQTQALDALNRKIHKDTRVFPSLVPIADGLMLARKI